MKDYFSYIINKYLGMNSETRERTILAIIMAIVDFLSAFNIIEFTDAQIQAIYKLVLVIVTAIVWAYCSHYKNNDYTEAGTIGTGITRQIKLEQDKDYIGERFYTNDDGSLLTEESSNFVTEQEDDDTMAAEFAAAEAESLEAEESEDDE